MMRFIHEACQQTCLAKLWSTMFLNMQNVNLLLLQIFKQISHEKDCSECQQSCYLAVRMVMSVILILHDLQFYKQVINIA